MRFNRFRQLQEGQADKPWHKPRTRADLVASIEAFRGAAHLHTRAGNHAYAKQVRRWLRDEKKRLKAFDKEAAREARKFGGTDADAP